MGQGPPRPTRASCRFHREASTPPPNTLKSEPRGDLGLAMPPSAGVKGLGHPSAPGPAQVGQAEGPQQVEPRALALAGRNMDGFQSSEASLG